MGLPGSIPGGPFRCDLRKSSVRAIESSSHDEGARSGRGGTNCPADSVHRGGQFGGVIKSKGLVYAQSQPSIRIKIHFFRPPQGCFWFSYVCCSAWALLLLVVLYLTLGSGTKQNRNGQGDTKTRGSKGSRREQTRTEPPLWLEGY